MVSTELDCIIAVAIYAYSSLAHRIPSSMEGEDPVDFDSAIDSFFDYFTDGADNGDDLIPQNLQQTVQRQTQQKRKRLKQLNRKKEKEKETEEHTNKPELVVAPTVVKSDVRRYYSLMFMNTINSGSGDFNQLQNYFSTFMRGPAKFQADYGKFNAQLRLPTQLIADGPKLMSHFILGVFVMYPDMVMHLKETRIITSNCWLGAKIEMDVEFLATKTYDLTLDEWVPQLQALEERCDYLEEEKRHKLRDKFSLPSLNSWPSDIHQHRNDDERSLSFGSSSSLSSVDSLQIEKRLSTVSVDSYADCTTSTTRAYQVDHRMDLSDDKSVSFPASKRKRVSCAARETAVTVAGDATSVSAAYRAPPWTTPSNNRIPEEYVHQLCEQAKKIPTPVELRQTGRLTLFLDEHHLIQHMHMRADPKEN